MARPFWTLLNLVFLGCNIAVFCSYTLAITLGVSDPFDSEQNIEGGVKYISDLTDKYKGDVERALAAYNAGSARVDSGNTPSATGRYVKNVMALYHRYREES